MAREIILTLKLCSLATSAMKFVTATGFFYLADAAALREHVVKGSQVSFKCDGAGGSAEVIMVSRNALLEVGWENSPHYLMFDDDASIEAPETIYLIAPSPAANCGKIKEVLMWIDSIEGSTLRDIEVPLKEGASAHEILRQAGFTDEVLKLVEKDETALKDFDELTHLSTVAEYLVFSKVQKVIHAAMAADLMQRCNNDTIGALVDEWRAQEKTKTSEASPRSSGYLRESVEGTLMAGEDHR